jgi:hydrophobe/amphiphile efflux-1 (HAE1) family protein
VRIAHFFIDRPIFATVISLAMMILGGIAFVMLPTAQYPDIVPPTVVVLANYPGASPEVIADTVATPIEQEVNGVENMLYMSSQCTVDGQMELTVTFKLGTDLDKAQVLVQNRVSTAEPRLPEEVRRQGVTTVKSSPDIILTIHLISPGERYEQLYLSNYALIQVRDALARIEGVGAVRTPGLRDYSMRIWLEPEQLSHRSLIPADVVRAIQAQNFQVAAGVVGQAPKSTKGDFQLTVKTLGRLTDPQQFADIIVRTGDDGRVVRVGDLGRIELGARDYSINNYVDGVVGAGMLISLRPGANALATADTIKETIDRLAKDFPEGLRYRISYNPTSFVRESIESVFHTLYEASVLVVIVVLVFLQNWRATLIPLIAIPVSLVGTFAGMAAFGFSLNMLTLFGLVLAIGIVVDDAIVVVENVERHMAAGLSPREAAHRAMDDVTAAVIAIAVGLSAVFVPTAFITGISGQFYRQFALTIACSTLLSAFVSLTLSPALCAILLQPHGARKDWFGRAWDFCFGWFFRGFNRAFESVSNRYARGVGWLLRRLALPLLLYATLIALTGYGFNKIPSGFIPRQDKGYLITAIQLPDGASLERTDAVVRRASEIIRKHPVVGHTVELVGFSALAWSNNPSSATIFFGPLLPGERKSPHDQPNILNELASVQAELMQIPDATIFVVPAPSVLGLGNAGGYKFLVEDRKGYGAKALQEATQELVEAARKEPALAAVFSTYSAGTPQAYIDIDRVKAQMLDVPLTNIFDTLQVNLGSAYVNDLNLYGRTFQVRAQADDKSRGHIEDIGRLKTRNASGGMLPLGSVVNVRWETGPDRMVRYNMYPSAEVQGDTAPGFSSGQAIATVERLAREILPQGMAIEWTDIAYQEQIAGNSALYIFPLCVLFVFLVHSAEYESWLLPLAIIMIAPVCLPFALGGVWLRGMDNNLITQISFVVLIGLAAKNAVLIVEFAKQQEEEGRSAFEAAVEACRLRLRPIMMTSFAFILGVLPLAWAIGPGYEMRRVLGTTVFSGMLGVTLFGLFLTPSFYVALRKLTGGGRKESLAQDVRGGTAH